MRHPRWASAALITLSVLPSAWAQKPAPAKPDKGSAVPSRVGIPSGSTGAFLVGTDDCVTPQPIAGQGVFPFDTSAATTGTQGQNETLCLFFSTSGVDRDVWFCWTPSISGPGRVETCNIAGTLDTKIAAYPGCGCPAPGTAIACNDDACGLRSRIDFNVVANNTYTIQLGHYPGSSGGTGQLRTDVLIPPTNDSCASPSVLPSTGTYPLDLLAATTGTQGQNETLCTAFGTSGVDSDIWYTWTSPCSGTATLTTCNLITVDTKVAAYPGAGCPQDGTALACNDDTCSLQSTISWATTAGATYTLQLGTFPGTGTNTVTGSFDLDLSGCTGGPGVAGCFGDGSGAACPCGNNGGPGEGCANSSGAGAVLSATGGTCPTDTIVLTVSNARPGQPGLFFQANNSLAGIPFGDGLRCCGGGVIRLAIIVPDGTGCAASDGSCGTPAGGQPGPISNHSGQPITLPCSGITRCYQYWYRNPTASPCGTNFNLTNNYTITW